MRLRRGPPRDPVLGLPLLAVLVLVVMIAVGGVPVPIVGVVDVVAVRNWLVPAAGAMHVAMAGVCQVRERMLIVVAVVRRVSMSFVHVVDMSLALGACMPAARPVYVVMIVNLMLGGCHVSSLL
jgi:hypothetical protein